MLQSDLKGNLACELSNIKCSGDKPKVLVTAVKLPTNAIEIITNTDNLEEKINYLTSAYDDEFKLKTNPRVQIVGFMLIGSYMESNSTILQETANILKNNCANPQTIECVEKVSEVVRID
jgi:hypothetical protein